MFCIKCGTKLEDSAKVCPVCNTEVPNSSKSKNEFFKKIAQKKIPVWMIAVIFVVLLIIFCVIFAIFSGNKNDEDKIPNTSNQIIQEQPESTETSEDNSSSKGKYRIAGNYKTVQHSILMRHNEELYNKIVETISVLEDDGTFDFIFKNPFYGDNNRNSTDSDSIRCMVAFYCDQRYYKIAHEILRGNGYESVVNPIYKESFFVGNLLDSENDFYQMAICSTIDESETQGLDLIPFYTENLVYVVNGPQNKFNTPNSKIGILRNSTAAVHIEEDKKFSEDQIVYYQYPQELQDALKNNDVDCIITDLANANRIVAFYNSETK